jgi:hypothetical protein
MSGDFDPNTFPSSTVHWESLLPSRALSGFSQGAKDFIKQYFRLTTTKAASVRLRRCANSSPPLTEIEAKKPEAAGKRRRPGV